jgi:type VI secretion system secreted protein Hcp
MAVDMFLEMDPIKGEAQDSKHKDHMEILSFSWGMNQGGTFHATSGGGAGKVSASDLAITKYTDKATAELMKACATGIHLNKGVLTCRKAGGKQQLDYLKITMEKVMVTGVQSGTSAGEDRETEHVTLNFQKVTVEYKQQLDTGAAGASPIFSYDFGKNIGN